MYKTVAMMIVLGSILIYSTIAARSTSIVAERAWDRMHQVSEMLER